VSVTDTVSVGDVLDGGGKPSNTNMENAPPGSTNMGAPTNFIQLEATVTKSQTRRSNKSQSESPIETSPVEASPIVASPFESKFVESAAQSAMKSAGSAMESASSALQANFPPPSFIQKKEENKKDSPSFTDKDLKTRTDDDTLVEPSAGIWSTIWGGIYGFFAFFGNLIYSFVVVPAMWLIGTVSHAVSYHPEVGDIKVGILI
jgi:hypothetical protein